MLKKPWEILKSLQLWLTTATSDREHIFITGAPRSGTTLIKTILTAHPAIAGGDYESTGLFKIRNLYEYSCGEIENGWIDVSCREAKNLIAFYDQLADALLDHYGGTYFVDKIWPQKYRLKYVTAKFPKAYWIHMVRDGRDSYCSALKHPNIPQSKSLKRFARYWERCNQLIDYEVPSSRTVVVRYEDLVADPEEIVPRIMQHVNLAVEDGQYCPGDAGRVASIRKREYHSRITGPIDDRSVGRGEKELGDEEFRHFGILVRDGLARYGYIDQ